MITIKLRRPAGNPSSWEHRLLIAGPVLAGAIISLYLALYQWRIISHVWDPFFRDPTGYYASGSERILNSWVSRLLPVPDAFLGFLAYSAEFVLSLIGGTDRWRSRPWVVVAFGGLAILLAAFGAALVLMQAYVFRTWCALCLCSAAISFSVLGPAVQELGAAMQALRDRRRRRRRSASLHFGRRFPGGHHT